MCQALGEIFSFPFLLYSFPAIISLPSSSPEVIRRLIQNNRADDARAIIPDPYFSSFPPRNRLNLSEREERRRVGVALNWTLPEGKMI